MIEIEQKAQALLLKAQGENPNCDPYTAAVLVLERASEQHEATEQKLHDFRQEVSHNVRLYREEQPYIWKQSASGYFSHFIITKPDPLVEVLKETYGASLVDADELRAALDGFGLEIREKNDD